MSRGRESAQDRVQHFSITDESDAGGPDRALTGGVSESASDRPGRPVRRRWAVAAVAVAVALAAGSGAVFVYRSRTVVTTRVVSSHGQATENLTGCPPDISCLFGSYSEGSQLFELMRQTFPRLELIEQTSVVDADSATTYRNTTIARDPSGLVISVITEQQPGGPRRRSWRTPSPAIGPAAVLRLAAGSRPGSSVAVSAQVPAGIAVPGALLDQLLDQAGQQSP